LKADVPTKPSVSTVMAAFPAIVFTTPVCASSRRTRPPACSIQKTLSAVSTAM